METVLNKWLGKRIIVDYNDRQVAGRLSKIYGEFIELEECDDETDIQVFNMFTVISISLEKEPEKQKEPDKDIEIISETIEEKVPWWVWALLILMFAGLIYLMLNPDMLKAAIGI